MKEIPLNHGYSTQVDDEDYELLSQHEWRISPGRNTMYAAMRGAHFQSLHRFLLKPPAELFVDHIDGNGLNNQRSNLRLCTDAQNKRNHGVRKNSTQEFKGVSKHANGKGWTVRMRDASGKMACYGTYAYPQMAALVYDKVALEVLGEFAWLNFPDLVGVHPHITVRKRIPTGPSKGVYVNPKGKYVVQIRRKGVCYNGGTHTTVEAAQAAYEELKARLDSEDQ